MFLAREPRHILALRARNNEGVITLADATAAGLKDHQVRHLVDTGEWLRLYRGVYADAGAPATPMRDVVAASRAIGGRGMASHRLGCWIWGVLDDRIPVLEFTVLQGRSGRVPGITIHRVSALPPGSMWRGMRVTSPLRALLDLAAVAPEKVEDAIIRGVVHAKLFTPKAVEAELGRAAIRGKPGVNALRAALKSLGVGRYTPSQLERRARRLFRQAGLPDPRVEVVFGEYGEYRLDFYWPEAQLVVEVDGWSVHAAPGARRNDFKKQNRVVRSDRWILRYDWFQVVHDSVTTAAEVVDAYRARTQLLT
jgi:very-short-patch-repair endonuclease